MNTPRCIVLLCVNMLCTGCSWTWNGDPLPFPVEGAPEEGVLVATPGPQESIQLVRGEGGGMWLALFMPPQDQPDPIPMTVRLVSLDDPSRTELHVADAVYLGQGAVYRVYRGVVPARRSGEGEGGGGDEDGGAGGDDGGADDGGGGAESGGEPGRVEVHTPGARESDRFLVPPGDASLLGAPGDDAFLYWVEGDATLHVFRRDDSLSRELSAPTIAFNQNARGAAFDGSGGRLLLRAQACGLAVAGPATRGCRPAILSYDTTDASGRADAVVDDVPESSMAAVDLASEALVVCGGRGLELRPIAGGRRRVLDGQAGCRPLLDVERDGIERAPPWIRAGRAFYEVVVGHRRQARMVPLDGSAPPHVLLDDIGDKKVLAFSNERVLYSEGQSFGGGAADGWIDGVRVMQRGRAAAFSSDGTRLRFLEHAATFNQGGDLLSVPLDEKSPMLRIATNVTQFDELPDGRVLAADDQAYTGTQNRIIVADERTGRARVLIENSPMYLRIPGSSDLLVQVWKEGASELRRIAVPPP